VLFKLRNHKGLKISRDNSSSVIIIFCIVKALHLLVNIFWRRVVDFVRLVGTCSGVWGGLRSPGPSPRARPGSFVPGSVGIFYCIIFLYSLAIYLFNLFFCLFVIFFFIVCHWHSHWGSWVWTMFFRHGSLVAWRT